MRERCSPRNEAGPNGAVKCRISDCLVFARSCANVWGNHDPIIYAIGKMSNEKDMQLGIRLRRVVEEFPGRPSLTGFANLVDIPYSTLQNYVRGEREPSASALAKILSHSGTNINWLLTGEGELALSDYPDKAIIDKLLVVFLHDIIDYLFKSEKCVFSSDEKARLVSYMMGADHLGLGQAIRLLLDSGDVDKFEELADWVEYLKDATTPFEEGD